MSANEPGRRGDCRELQGTSPPADVALKRPEPGLLDLLGFNKSLGIPMLLRTGLPASGSLLKTGKEARA